MPRFSRLRTGQVALEFHELGGTFRGTDQPAFVSVLTIRLVKRRDIRLVNEIFYYLDENEYETLMMRVPNGFAKVKPSSDIR